MFKLQTAILPCIFNSGHVAFAGDVVAICTSQGFFRGKISSITIDSIDLWVGDKPSGLIPVCEIYSFEVLSRGVCSLVSVL